MKYSALKKSRDKHGIFIVEGEKFVTEIPKNFQIVKYIVSKSYKQKAQEQKSLAILESRAELEVVLDSVFEGLSDTVTPQGIMAVCKKINRRLADILPNLKAAGFILLCENLSDPGNVGTLIRTAAAAGAAGVVLTSGSADMYNPKVIRASACAALRLPIVCNVSLSESLEALKSVPVYAADPYGDSPPCNLNLVAPFTLIIGNEARGLTKEARSAADALIKLPMVNETESLNASIAGSIIMYEAVRQRYPYKK